MKIRKFFKIFKEEMEKGYKEEKKRQDENKAVFIAKNEKKTSDFLAKHKFVTALIVLLPVFLILSFINSFFPLTVYDDINGMEPANGIEYFSEEYKVGKKTVAIYACLDAASEYVDNQGDNQFVINVAEIKGPLKNRYYLYSNSFLPDEMVLNPEYKYIVDFPEYEVKSNSKYYGSVYTGIAPADCESITIGGVEAEMERFTFDLNGKAADFYLYYCVIEQDEYPDELPVICRRTNGELLSISSVDGEDSKVTIIENGNAVNE